MRDFWISSILCGLRARSLQAVAMLGVLLVAGALLAGSFSARQPQTVVLDVGFSGIYFTLVLLALFLIQELLAREIDRRTVYFALSYPLPRSAYLWGRYLGILVIAAIATLILGLLLMLAVLVAAPHYEQQFGVLLGWPFWLALLGVWIDVAVVTAFCVWIATVSTVSMMPMALGIVFAIAGRALGVVLDYLGSGADGDHQLVAVYQPILTLVQWVLPDLSRLDWRAWSMYGIAPAWQTVCGGVVMAFAYAVLMLLLANRTFSRREFA